MVWLLRQGAGRPAEPNTVEAMLGTVRHRRQLIDAKIKLQQRLHDQLNALCPGLSAPPRHGRRAPIDSPTGQAVLACAVAFAGPSALGEITDQQGPGRLTSATAAFWADRWKQLLAPPPDAELRAARLGRELRRWQELHADIVLAEQQLAALLARTPGAGPDLAAWSRCRSRCRVLGLHAADRSLGHPRAPLLGHRPCASDLPILDDHQARRDQPPRPARTPRRADGDRLGTLALQLEFPPARYGAPRSRHATNPSPGGALTTRLPPLLAPASNPRTLRRTAIRSDPEGRAVTAFSAMPLDGAT